MSVKKNIPYTLGLDIGIASVGWCLLGSESILGIGVRAFDAAEIPKNGAPLNADRRSKRLMRRRLRRRAHRLLRLRRLCKREGLCVPDSPDSALLSPWVLRVEGLDRLLTPAEWQVVIHHLVKNRGFHSNRKSELNPTDRETGQLLAGLNANQHLLATGHYRTAAELAYRHESFALHKRNKAGAYTLSFTRRSLADELGCLFATQRELGNCHTSECFEQQVMALFWSQRPPLTGEAMLRLIGRCSLDETEFRAPKCSHSTEWFIWLSKLNNLRLFDGEAERSLTGAERDALINLPFSGKSDKVRYVDIRKILARTVGFDTAIRFKGLAYRYDGADKNPENTTVFSPVGWIGLRRAYEKASLQTQWQMLAQQPDRLDVAAYALTVLKTDQEIWDHLHANGFPEAEIQALIPLHFKDFVKLSIKALQKLLPLMREGARYDEAATALYGSHSAPQHVPPRRLLAAIPPDDIRNPVVQRALNQARKVVNALIREYGSPVRIHIELARNLSRSFDERDEIKKAQAKFRDQKQDDIAGFKAQFGFEPHPKNQDLLRWRLYREQDGQCPYTQQPLAAHGDPATIFDPTRTQIDHVLPYSRSFDDGYNNKVLVMVAANQTKGNHTPYEYLQGASDSPRWQMFQAWVKSNRKLREAKRQRLLRTQFDTRAAREFRDRHLTDTRYICRYFKAQLEQLALNTDAKAQRCVVVNGQLTAYLRTRWGLLKARTDGDLHHALDAAVVAACSHAMVKRLADYARRGELERVKNPIDAETGEVVDMATLREVEARFPQPYDHFREELLDRLAVDPHFGPPIRVSRAPKRRNGGAVHEDTIRSSKRMARDGVSTLKKSLTKLRLADLARLAARDDPRNVPLYTAIEERLKAFGGDGTKAFGPDQPPLRKPGNADTAPIVRSVRLETPQKSGVPVRGGIADNDTLLRLDVFARQGRHYLVPIYLADVLKPELPMRAIVAARPEQEWTLMDPDYDFLFSLYPNDFVMITFRDKPTISGYYAGVDRSTGGVSVRVHDRSPREVKDGLHRGIGVKTALSIEKYHVDVLGRCYPAGREVRRDLAQHRR